MGPHYDSSNHWVNAFGLVEQQWMAVMTMSFLDTLAATGRERAPALQPGLFDAVREHMRAALERRRQRRAAARLVLNEHLRRDVGLPPFTERRW